MNAHLTRHRFANATLDDLVGALDAASPRDVRGWAEVWLRRSGHDTIRVARDGDVPVLVRDGVRPHRFLVTAYDDGLAEVGSRLVDLDDEPVRLPDGPAGSWYPTRTARRSPGSCSTSARGPPSRTGSAALDGRPGARGAVGDGPRRGRQPRPRRRRGTSPSSTRHLPAERHVEPGQRRRRRDPGPDAVRRGCRAADADARARAARRGLPGRARRGGGERVAFTRGLARASRDVDELRRWLADDRTDHDVGARPAAAAGRSVHRLAELGAP